MPEIGYQEVYLARAFARLGHDVRIVTSNVPSPSGRNIVKKSYDVGVSQDRKYGFSIFRLGVVFKYGTAVLCAGLEDSLREISPDLVVVVGVGKLFPYPILKERGNRKYKLVLLLGDNSDMYDRSSFRLRVKTKLIQKIIKNRIYRKGISASDRVFLYTRETEQIVNSYIPRSLREELQSKKIITSLGFDPEEYFYDVKERDVIRKELRISSNDIVYITSTRIYPRKKIERVVDEISSLRSKGIGAHYIIIGFLGDSYDKQLREYIFSKGNSEAFHCYGFMKHHEIRKYFNAADIGVWINPAISIQEGMGTGLKVILENKLSVNHLVTEGANGWYFEKGEIDSAIGRSAKQMLLKSSEERNIERVRLAKTNYDRLSYDGIARELLESTFH